MKSLIFDTETTGIPDFYKPADDPSQPRVASLAAILFDGDQEVVVIDHLCDGADWTDKAKANLNNLTDLHGINFAALQKDGIPIADILTKFGGLMDEAEILVAYGVAFDLKMMRGEWRRAGLPDRYQKLPNFCVMKAAAPLCKLPPTDRMLAAGIGGYKTPKLAEAVKILLGEELQGAHRAINDVRATAKLYRFLKDREDGK